MPEKHCSKCRISKPLDQFSPHARGPQGRQPRCKECCAADQKARYGKDPELSNRKQLARIHGLTLAEYDALYAAGCAICGTHDPGTKRRMHVDHDHATGKVRGVLCPLCNVGLGHFKDSPALLAKAAQYLAA
jgi:hypothetical protein